MPDASDFGSLCKLLKWAMLGSWVKGDRMLYCREGNKENRH